MKKTNQQGFAVIEAALIVVVVAILGFTGWFVWHAKQSTDKTLSDTANSQPALQSKKSAAKDKETPSDGGSSANTTYLTIAEFGVKLKLTDATTGSTYRTDIEPNEIFLTTELLKTTNCSLDNSGVGFLKRFSEGEINSETKAPYKNQYPDAVKVGAYYYGFGINPAFETCSSDSSVQAKAVAARAAFKQALTTIQAAN